MTDETPHATSRRTLLAGMALMAAAGAISSRAKAGGDMKHVVLLGDSIFDNKRYVGEEPDVIDQLKADLPAGWTASLNALDGSTTFDIAGQLKRLPPTPPISWSASAATMRSSTRTCSTRRRARSPRCSTSSARSGPSSRRTTGRCSTACSR